MVKMYPTMHDSLCPLSCQKIMYAKMKNISMISFLDLNQILEDLIVRPENAGKLTCAQCGKTFDDMYKIRRHAETHLGMRLPCNLCDKVCSTRNALSIHYARVHGDQVQSSWSMK